MPSDGKKHLTDGTYKEGPDGLRREKLKEADKDHGGML
jgi:hypothetical protein